MSRENSVEDVSAHSSVTYAINSLLLSPENEAGPSRPRQAQRGSPSSRPTLSLASVRNASYSGKPASPRSPISPVLGEGGRKRMGLKRRISTPIATGLQIDEDESTDTVYGNMPSSVPPPSTIKTEVQSRARATSTSLVSPSSALVNSAPTIPVATSPLRPMFPLASNRPSAIALPKPTLAFIPPSPEANVPPLSPPPPQSILERAYNTTETSLRRLTSIFRPHAPIASGYVPYRRGSDEDGDSEKGLADEDYHLGAGEDPSSSSEGTSARRSMEKGRYWGLWASEDQSTSDGYFSLPPTPPDEPSRAAARASEFELALLEANGKISSLPTPALSAHSLSRRGIGRNGVSGRVRDGWLSGVLSGWVGGGERGKTGAVLRELGWTLGVLILGFMGSLGMALWLLKGLPITTLRHLPQSTTDLQLLSAEIRTYMSSSDAGWWHTVGVLIFVGCWKHAWSVPGAIVLNILVGSLLSPLPAVALLTFITATGSLGSYLLSRPLAPLIAVLFPKPLSLVRAALAPESAPPPTSTHPSPSSIEHVTPIDPISSTGTSVWRRLLIMRAMGIVPWSGMNVACGVVGVNWRTFWLTTAAGSASWSYTTASIGDLLGRLSTPTSSTGLDGVEVEGESLTGMLRDPILLTKLVFLTGLTLIPVFMKRSSTRAAGDATAAVAVAAGGVVGTTTPPLVGTGMDEKAGMTLESPTTPSSALAQSLARFTPTPAAFDILSFGRTLARTAVSAAGAGARQVGLVLGRVAR